MMSCDTVKGLISNLIDNSLDQEDKSQMEQHLEHCSECNRVVKQVRYLTQRLHRANPYRVSGSFDERLRQRIYNDRQMEKPVFSVRNFSYGLSGVAVLAAISFVVITNLNSPQTDPGNTAQPMNRITRTQEFASPIKQAGAATDPAIHMLPAANMDSSKNKTEQIIKENVKLVDQNQGDYPQQ